MRIPEYEDDGQLFIVLSPDQISHWDLVCGFRSNYPRVRLVAQKLIETATKTQTNSKRDRETPAK